MLEGEIIHVEDRRGYGPLNVLEQDPSRIPILLVDRYHRAAVRIPKEAGLPRDASQQLIELRSHIGSSGARL